MPQIGLGVLHSANGSETENAVQYALEAGYRQIDTAAVYGNECEVGNIVNSGVVPREQIFVTSKAWIPGLSYNGAKQAFNETMDRLGFGYLDLYLIDWPTNDWKGAWRALEELYQEGRVKAIGVSNFLAHHLNALLSIAAILPAVNQYEMHPFLQQFGVKMPEKR